MKKQIILLLLSVICMKTNAQLSTLKAGVNLNSDKVDYPSWELSFERALGKKFSINGTYNYSQFHKDVNQEALISNNLGPIYGATGFTHYNHTLIIEGRYYLKSNTTGVFFQMGIPFTYYTEERFYTSPSGDGSVKHNFFAICTIGGFGIKYPFTKNFGVEMSMNFSPSFNFLDVDYGTSGFIKSGVKLFYSFDKATRMNTAR